MISHLNGVIDSIEPGRITIDVGGVGYLVKVPPSFLAGGIKIGDRVKINTCQVVREDDISLYGFAAKEEKNLFSTLLSVSGIGPKGAMALISSIPLDKLVAAITKGNVDMISTVKGIGLKTAQRVVIELKEKVAKAYSVEPSKMSHGIPSEDRTLKDAVSALMTLGYSPSEARSAIKNAGIDASEDLTIEEIIKKALRALV